MAARRSNVASSRKSLLSPSVPELRLTATFLCFFCPCRPSAAHWSTARASASSRGRFTYGHVTSANTAGWPTVSLDPRSCGVNKRELTRSLDSRKIRLESGSKHIVRRSLGAIATCSCIRLLFFSLFFFALEILAFVQRIKKNRKRKRGESNHRKTHYQAQDHTL